MVSIVVSLTVSRREGRRPREVIAISSTTLSIIDSDGLKSLYLGQPRRKASVCGGGTLGVMMTSLAAESDR